MNYIVLIGYSGHAFVVAEAIKLMGHTVVGYCEKTEAKRNPFNLTYIGDERYEIALSKIKELRARFFVSIGNNKIRKDVNQLLYSAGLNNSIVIHPTSIISTLATVGSGSFVGPAAIINPLAELGKGVIVNTAAVVEHECHIGDYSHIAPGAVLAGNVRIGRNTFVGANSVIKQGINIGENVVIGAGSTVIKDIPDNQVWVGNPAKLLNK
jgi:sugar O-acyltransferase (sialic acid O-acetyltransferase NeuD family)